MKKHEIKNFDMIADVLRSQLFMYIHQHVWESLLIKNRPFEFSKHRQKMYDLGFLGKKSVCFHTTDAKAFITIYEIAANYQAELEKLGIKNNPLTDAIRIYEKINRNELASAISSLNLWLVEQDRLRAYRRLTGGDFTMVKHYFYKNYYNNSFDGYEDGIINFVARKSPLKAAAARKSQAAQKKAAFEFAVNNFAQQIGWGAKSRNGMASEIVKKHKIELLKSFPPSRSLHAPDVWLSEKVDAALKNLNYPKLRSGISK